MFLPNFFMKIVKPRDPQPPNVVQFQVSPEMTKHDIKNYLEKIYNVPVENIITHNRMGEQDVRRETEQERVCET